MILIAAVLATIIATAAATWAVTAMPWRRVTKRPALIHLDTGATVDGIIIHRRGPLLTLANARTFAPNGDSVSLDGLMTLERARIAWIQTGHGSG